MKTEAVKGNKEYSPSKTIAMGINLSVEQQEAWDTQYRKDVVERIKVFKAIEAKGYVMFERLVTFNNDLASPAWSWNNEAFKDLGTWQLRDLAVLLENKKGLKRIIS